ncbi:hypothetical protein [Rhodobacter sp. NSM]|uniref:hypothetical protein n=1 Tax=Rhodobacter sp. NSM TaxID=3457501 RepID=UPI003FD28FC0
MYHMLPVVALAAAIIAGPARADFIGQFVQCWNVGTLSSDGLRAVVTVSVTFDHTGRPDPAAIRLQGYTGSTPAGAREAFGVASRAITRCKPTGKPGSTIWLKISTDGVRVLPPPDPSPSIEI